MDIRLTDDGYHDLDEEALKALTDPFFYGRLFYYADACNIQRGLHYEYSKETEPFKYYSGPELKAKGWKFYNGVYFDPKRWDENDIDLFRQEILRMVQIHKDLLEQFKRVHKIRDSRKKRIERDPNWDYAKGTWKPGCSPADREAADAAGP